MMTKSSSLRQSRTDAASPSSGGPEGLEGWRLFGVPTRRVAEEARALAPLCAQTSASMLLTRCPTIVTLLFVGRLGSAQLAAAALAQSVANVSGNSMIVGAANALPTLVSQAFGAKDYQECGRWLQRGSLLTLLVAALIAVPWLNMGRILASLGQPEELSREASRYLRMLLPGLVCYAGVQSQVQFLVAQRIMMPQLRVSVLVAALHPLMVYLAAFTLGWGNLGAAGALSFSILMTVVGIAVHLHKSGTLFKPHRTWPHEGWSRRALQRWPEMLRLALPSLVMISEWWASEAGVLAGGYLDDPDAAVSVLAISQSCNSVCFMVPIGIAMSGAAKVGNRLGEGDAEGARAVAVAATCLGFGATVIVSALILAGRFWVGTAFGASESVRSLLPPVLAVLAAYVVADGMTVVLSGILRGCGRQMWLAPVVVGSYWAFGLPVCYLLAFRAGWGPLGIAVGLFAGTLCHCICCVVLVLRLDYDNECHRAAEQTARGRALGEAHKAELRKKNSNLSMCPDDPDGFGLADDLNDEGAGLLAAHGGDYSSDVVVELTEVK